MQYKYISDNNLINKQNYMYSEFGGQEFINAYFISRKEFINKYQSDNSLSEIELASKYDTTLSNFMKLLKEETGHRLTNASMKEEIDLYVKRFEVRKLLYSHYDESGKPAEGADYTNFDSYLIFGKILIDSYRESRILKYLNCLLKINDTLLSINTMLSENQKVYLTQILKQECNMISEIAKLHQLEMEIGYDN